MSHALLPWQANPSASRSEAQPEVARGPETPTRSVRHVAYFSDRLLTI